jgi:hypothetical protein
VFTKICLCIAPESEAVGSPLTEPKIDLGWRCDFRRLARMSARGTAHRRRARRAGRGAWLAVLLVPTAVLSVVLKVVRLAQGPWWTRPADLVSDLTFSAAWIVGWWVLAVAGSRRLTRALVLAAAQLSTWAWSVLLVVYHEYWMRTRNTLTLDRLMATWRGRHDLSGLLGTQLTAGTLALLAGRLSGARCCRRCWSC